MSKIISAIFGVLAGAVGLLIGGLARARRASKNNAAAAQAREDSLWRSISSARAHRTRVGEIERQTAIHRASSDPDSAIRAILKKNNEQAEK